MYKAIIIMDAIFVAQVYPVELRNKLEEHLIFVSEPITKEELSHNLDLLTEVDFIFTSWGAPSFSEEVLKHAPKLKVVFHGAGSIKKIVTEAFWVQNIRITTAAQANAIPVAEFTLACTIMGLKNALNMRNKILTTKEYPKPGTRDIKGNFQARIGLIALGTISRYLLKLYKNFDYKIMAYDPFVNEVEASKLGVELVSLETIFKDSDVVSLHTPLLEETKGLIGREHFELMKENSVFINTARGALIKEEEMLEFLEKRQDVTAYLDVVYPEPPANDSKLYRLKNVYLTPHIAGSEGGEISRLGYFMYDELIRYIEEEKLEYEVTKRIFERMA